MHHKYQNRKDISILVIEKNLRPEGASITSDHNITEVGYFLDKHGFDVDMILSISNYKFKDFEIFRKKTEKIRDNRYKHIEDEILRKICESGLPSFKLLRNKPVNCLDDLAAYRFIISHPDFVDGDKLLEFAKKYPNIPIICPHESANIDHRDGREEISPNVERDAYGVYVLNEWGLTDMCIGTLEFIEHLLDEKNVQGI